MHYLGCSDSANWTLSGTLTQIFVQLAGRRFGSKLIPNKNGVPAEKIPTITPFRPVYTPAYCIPSCITLRPLPIHAKFHWNRRNCFVDGWTDGHLRPALLGRLCRRVDLKKNRKQNISLPSIKKHCLWVTAHSWHLAVIWRHVCCGL